MCGQLLRQLRHSLSDVPFWKNTTEITKNTNIPKLLERKKQTTAFSAVGGTRGRREAAGADQAEPGWRNESGSRRPPPRVAVNKAVGRVRGPHDAPKESADRCSPVVKVKIGRPEARSNLSAALRLCCAKGQLAARHEQGRGSRERIRKNTLRNGRCPVQAVLGSRVPQLPRVAGAHLLPAARQGRSLQPGRPA